VTARPRWHWDHPEPEATVRGWTIMADGWVTGGPDESEVVLTSGGRVLAATVLRHARPDVAVAHLLGDDAVGFHLEADARALGAAGARVTLALGLRAPGEALVPLAERTVRLDDAEPLPYEDTFRDAEARGALLGRGDVYRSGPPVLVTFPETLSIVRRFAGPHVLDLGCGAGPYTLALREAGHTVQALEYDETPARVARERGVPVVRGDGRRLPFPDGLFDTVVAVEVIEHIEAAAETVAECARVTRGNFLVSVPNAAVIPHLWPAGVVPWHLLEATHVNFFSAGSLEALLRRSFAHVLVGFYARSYFFPHLPPLYAHLYAVAAHEADAVRPVASRPRRGWSTLLAERLRRWLRR
jgi:SAM-dependent methyltransferase